MRISDHKFPEAGKVQPLSNLVSSDRDVAVSIRKFPKDVEMLPLSSLMRTDKVASMSHLSETDHFIYRNLVSGFWQDIENNIPGSFDRDNAVYQLGKISQLLSGNRKRDKREIWEID